MTEYKLTYFDVKGLAEPIRLLLNLKKVQFEDVRLPFVPGQPGVIPAEIKEKLTFGQVPALEFDGQVLCQSGTILRFLARRFDLFGSSEIEAAKIDELNDGLKDYADAWKPVFYAKDDETKAAALANAVDVATPKYFDNFQRILEKNGNQFFVGNKISLIDLNMFNLLTYFGPLFETDLTKNHPSLVAFVKRIEEVPEIKDYLERRPKSVR